MIAPDGRRHIFSQIPAGAFVPGVEGWLVDPMVIHPGALLVELSYLARLGLNDVVERLRIDRRCRVITPFHQAANRLREQARSVRHGSCGVGFGERVADGLSGAPDLLWAGDLSHPREVLDRLHAQPGRAREAIGGGAGPDWELLCDPSAPRRILDAWAPFPLSTLRDAEDLGDRLRHPIVFEGAQGVLLDETWGFHPHTTWSDCTGATAHALLHRLGFAGEVERVGVLRAHACRHGAGPFPSEDPTWTAALPCPTNGSNPWQGAFRVGPFDAVLTRYALSVMGGVDRLVITHLDRPAPQAVAAYLGPADPTLFDGAPIRTLVEGDRGDLEHRARLGRALGRVRPLREEVHDLAGWISAQLGALAPARIGPAC